MRLTWMGNACFALESGDLKVLFDPFLELAGGTTPADPEKLRRYDTIFVTHCHFDHLYEAAELLEQGEGGVTLFCTRQCCATLEDFLEDTSSVVEIRAGQTYDLYNGRSCGPRDSAQAGEPGQMRIRVLRGRHIEFQLRRAADTLSPLRVLRYAGNLPFLFWANRAFREAGETVAFDVQAEGKEILVLGSLALDPEETYPEGADVVLLPYQGNNDLPARAREVLERLRPKGVVLSHFDNAFPPMSRDTDLRPLKKLVREEFPDIRMVRPAAFRPIRL